MSYNPNPSRFPLTCPQLSSNEWLNDNPTANPLFSPATYTRSIRNDQPQLSHPQSTSHVEGTDPSGRSYPAYATQFRDQGSSSYPSYGDLQRDDAMLVDYDPRRREYYQPTPVHGSSNFSLPNPNTLGKRKMDEISRIGSPRPRKYFAYSQNTGMASTSAQASSSNDQVINCRICEIEGVVTKILKSEEYHHLETMHPKYTSKNSARVDMNDRYMWCGPCNIQGRKTRIKKTDELVHMEREHPEYFA
ncbi:hypothetical protein Clacol_006973 [Clathrus columnatus]|uniref:Uncharacterized protein n=1 Tax=Clathrus columnatus TaxID=1419009 RepID=A0AAV5AJ92_9AGAM|nr:hypothetical protein Clacol_006973 [Clathrus columnatus]